MPYLERRQYGGIACGLIAVILGSVALSTRQSAIDKLERNQETLNVRSEVLTYDANPHNASDLQNDVCIPPELFGSFPSCDSLLPVTEGECLNNEDCCYQKDKRCKSCRECVRHERQCFGSGDDRICSLVCTEHRTNPCCSMESYCRVQGQKKYNKIWGFTYTPEWTVNVTAGSQYIGVFTIDTDCGFNDNTCVDRFADERGEGEVFEAYYHRKSHTYSEEAPDNGDKDFKTSYILMSFFLVFFVATCVLFYPELAVLFMCCYATCSRLAESTEKPPEMPRVDSADRDPELDQPQDLESGGAGFTMVKDPSPQGSSVYTHLKIMMVGASGRIDTPRWVDVHSLEQSVLQSLIQHAGDFAGEHNSTQEYRMNIISVIQHGTLTKPHGSHDYVVAINEYDKPKDAKYMVVYQANESQPKYIDTLQIDHVTSELFDCYNGTSVDSTQATQDDFVNLLYAISVHGADQIPADFGSATHYVFAVNHTFKC